jgi:hypothetical protein
VYIHLNNLISGSDIHSNGGTTLNSVPEGGGGGEF